MTDLPPLWPACLERLEAELSAQQFNTWIKPLVCEQGVEGYVLLAPNRFIMQFIKERFLGRVQTLAAEILGEAVLIELKNGAPSKASAMPVTAPEVVSVENTPIKPTLPPVPIGCLYPPPRYQR